MKYFPKPTVNKTKLLYRLPPYFYLFPLCILIIRAAIFRWFSGRRPDDARGTLFQPQPVDRLLGMVNPGGALRRDVHLVS